MIKKLRKFIAQHFMIFLGVLVVINVCIIVAIGLIWTGKNKNEPKASTSNQAKEIQEIKSTTNTRLRSTLYRQLIERVGPTEAQEDLVHSGLPFDGETHLLNHTVGDWLYTKYGTSGLTYCKDYFLSSCYHGFLIKFIGDKGMNSLDEVMKACWKVGTGTATQCAHAIGHGVLAWEGYKYLPEALKDCDKVASISPKFLTYNCYDGVFMENNWAVHDDGSPSADRWVKDADPTYPCYDDAIEEKYRRACWSNQPQVMFKMFGGDIAKVAKACEDIKAKEYQETCFDSLARQINPAAKGDPKMVFEMCNYVPVGWKSKCVDSNVSAFFSVGDHDIPLTLCEMIPDSGRAGCYQTLQQRIPIYVNTLAERITLCKKVPEVFRSQQFCPST